jgi:hypothetical protein
MSYLADPRVDAYIEALPGWQQAICREVRELVHGADPEVEETIKRTRQPYFVLNGNICALLAAKDHINIFMYDGAIVPDPEGIITGGHDNKLPARSRSGRARPSTRAPSRRCSVRSSRTTGRVAGGSSSASSDEYRVVVAGHHLGAAAGPEVSYHRDNVPAWSPSTMCAGSRGRYRAARNT